MLRLLALVISIGLADSLNPTTVGPALVLAAGVHPRHRVLQFTAATFLVFLAGGLILTLGPGAAIVSLVPRPDATVRYVLETIAGAAMLVAGALLWRRRERIRNRAHEPSAPGGRVAKAARNPWLLGATISIIELPTAFPYFAVIAAIVGSGYGLLHQVVLVVIYNVCFVAPLLVIVLLLTVFHERAVGMLQRARGYLRARWPTAVAVIAFVVGAFVIILGVTGLTGRAPGALGTVSRRVRRAIPK